MVVRNDTGCADADQKMRTDTEMEVMAPTSGEQNAADARSALKNGIASHRRYSGA
jgi:hypothetical protein